MSEHSVITFYNVVERFLAFATGCYGRYLLMFFIIAFVETIMVILLHAILGHGLRFNWLFGSNIFLPKDNAKNSSVVEKQNNLAFNKFGKYTSKHFRR